MAGERKVRSFSLNIEEDKDILDKLEEVKRIVMEILKDKSIEIKEEDVNKKFDLDVIEALDQF